MERKITEVPGVGKKTEKELSDLGIRTLHDMLTFRPRAYDDRRQERRIRDASIADPSISCRITVLRHSEFSSKGGRTLKVSAEDDDGTHIELLCFNRYFLKQQLRLGSSWYIYGKAMRNRGIYQISSFEIKKTKEEAGIGRILPVYPLSGNLSEKLMRNAAEYSLHALSPIPDELPQTMYERQNLIHHSDAYKNIHFPSSMEYAKAALNTLAFTELFIMELSVLRERKQGARKKSSPTALEKKLVSGLPFTLTEDQLKAADEIRADMDSPIAMNRLLQGDVGSGKTLVAWLTALHAIAEGKQVAFMAPTELLARQHADGAAALLSPLGIRIAIHYR